jgi:superfamily II DNA or RNA helicase
MKISKVNEVYLQLEVDEDISREISDYFTFEVPGAKFMPQFRNRMWDGKIRMFSPHNGRIYVGLLPYIKEYCTKKSIPYTIEEGVENVRNVIRENVREFAESLRPTSRGKPIQFRDYQIDAIWHAIKSNRCLLLSPTASGKSLIIYTLVRYYHLMNLKTLILVPTTSLVEQMYSDFIDYGWEDKNLHRVYAGMDKGSKKPVVISTWQSIYKLHSPYFAQYGCIIGDEAHMFKAKSLTDIMTRSRDVRYRFGLTGTLDGTETHRLVLEGLFGQVKKIITTKELIDRGTLAQLEIDCIVLKHTEEEAQRVRYYTYAEEINYIVSHEKRNKFIERLCKNITGNTLLLFQLVEKHGVLLYNELKKLDRKVFFVYGGTTTDTREKIRAITELEKDAIIVASYGTFSTGINIRNIHNIVFASPSKSRVRVLQSIGRGLRQTDDKSRVKLFDVSDNVSYKSRPNFTYRHFTQRLNIYKEEQFNYKINRINL